MRDGAGSKRARNPPSRKAAAAARALSRGAEAGEQKPPDAPAGNGAGYTGDRTHDAALFFDRVRRRRTFTVISALARGRGRGRA